MRKATEKDREQLARWIGADPDHAGKTKPELFYEEHKGVNCFAFTDESGEVFYVRISKVLRVDIQFAPPTEASQERVRWLLLRGFTWLLDSAQKAGYRQVIFQSKVAPLIRFCKKRFGFEASPDELVCSIGAADAGPKQANVAAAEERTT